MPRVPSASGNVLPFPQKPPEEVYIAMAAAQMNMQGKLFEPEQSPNMENSAEATADHIRKNGEVRFSPEGGSWKGADDLMKNLPDDIEREDIGKGSTRTIRLKVKDGAPTS